MGIPLFTDQPKGALGVVIRCVSVCFLQVRTIFLPNRDPVPSFVLLWAVMLAGRKLGGQKDLRNPVDPVDPVGCPGVWAPRTLRAFATMSEISTHRLTHPEV